MGSNLNIQAYEDAEYPRQEMIKETMIRYGVILSILGEFEEDVIFLIHQQKKKRKEIILLFD